MPLESAIIGKVAASVLGLSAVGVTALAVPFVTPALRKICLPYVPATDDQIHNVLLALDGCEGKKILDLGSGDGRVVHAAASRGWDATGVELNPWLVGYSRIRSRYLGQALNTRFYRKDMWKFPLSNFDVVIIFGTETMMPLLEQKLLAELKPQSFVIACRFPCSQLPCLNTFGAGIDTVWLYNMLSLRK